MDEEVLVLLTTSTIKMFGNCKGTMWSPRILDLLVIKWRCQEEESWSMSCTLISSASSCTRRQTILQRTWKVLIGESTGTLGWWKSDEQPTIGHHLNPEQQEELHRIQEEYSNILDNKPGWTNLTEHDMIESLSAPRMRHPPYCLPYAHWDAELQRFEDMERHSMFKPSISDWAAPTTDGPIDHLPTIVPR